MRIIDTHPFFTDDRTDADKNTLKTGMILDGDDGELEGL